MAEFEELAKNMAEFLEKWPPLRKYRKPIADELGNRARPAIHMFCANCSTERTFVNLGSQSRHGGHYNFYDSLPAPFDVELARYLCAACKSFGRLFVLETGETDGKSFIRKIGQKPDWEVILEDRVVQSLGTREALFRRGIDCESSGYGVGAYAYYRRVVEDIIDELLDLIQPLIEREGQAKYAEALKNTKAAIVAQDKIVLLKDLLPPSLCRGGFNPLSIIYSALSEGIHARTDEECLDLAGAVRESLVFLIDELKRSDESQRRFTEGMRKFLDKRNTNKGSESDT